MVDYKDAIEEINNLKVERRKLRHRLIIYVIMFAVITVSFILSVVYTVMRYTTTMLVISIGIFVFDFVIYRFMIVHTRDKIDINDIITEKMIECRDNEYKNMFY